MAMSARRPLPALAFLLALSLLTALVWWRVFDRASGDEPVSSGTTCAPQQNIDLPSPDAVSVLVLNGTAVGTNRVGLAGYVASSLQTDGFQVGTPANDTVAVAGVAELRFSDAGLAAATLLTYYIPGAIMRPDKTIADATVTVSIGEEFPQTGGVNNPDQAAAAKAAAEAAPSTGEAKPC